MTNRDVMVVLTNYKRPSNMPEVICGWKEQTVKPSYLVVVDNSPAGQHNYFSTLVDDVWRFTRNLRCSCRFAPALMIAEFPYVVFADDDIVPTVNAIELLLKEAELVGDKFTTIGPRGRNFKLDRLPGRRYTYGNPPVGKVDMTCCCHLVKQDDLRHLLDFKSGITSIFGEEGRDLSTIHDDMTMCLGVQMVTGHPSYLSGNRVIEKTLDEKDTEALHRRPGHLAERCRMVDMAVEWGWRSVR